VRVRVCVYARVREHVCVEKTELARTRERECAFVSVRVYIYIS